jgi:carboxypeptidase family protein
MCSKLPKALLLSVISVAACSKAFACSCKLLSAHDRYQNADTVFVGTAVSKTDSADHIRFHIDESFWGTTGDSIVVRHYDPVICDSFSFKVGEKYLVVAYKQNDELTVTSCNQGSGIVYATGDIHALRAQREGKPLPYVYGVVLSKSGMPLVDARVTLHSQANPNSSALMETRTREDGYFEFRSVPPGGYLVKARPKTGGSPIRDSFATGDPGVRLMMYEW